VFRLFSAVLLCTICLAQERESLLNPKALPKKPAATLRELRQGFNDPPAEYRSMPLWVWNDEMNPSRISEMLQQYKEQGFGGAFVHPRPGLITPYLGAEWFKLWRTSLNMGKQLGLLVNIYDENSYPSGFAGGHVPARAPDTASQYVAAQTGLPASAVSPNPLSVAFFAGASTSNMRRVYSRSEVRDGESVTAFRLRRASGNPWTGEFPYVDLTNPRTTPLFLETTYEAYKREFGAEFGKTIKWAFTDEPLLATGGAYDSARLALPLSFNTLAQFRQRNGYDLADHIASLYWDTGDFRKVRFDYWQTLHDLWKENFMRPMFEWCDRNGLQFTGHWMEHEWPFPWITPDDASLYAYEHVPGIDMLEGTNLRLNGQDPHLLFTIRQVASVSHQLGRRAFCEAYGVAGWDSTFEHYKRFGDWLMVHGINFMDQHLSFSTIRGARKRDHPQSFSDISAWWPWYRTHADHLARVSYLSSLSAPRHRVLVVQQTTSGFLLARRGGATPELSQMRENNARLNQFLADHQVDYDLGDEYILEWFGKVNGRKFTVGKAAYDLLVLPPDLSNLRKQTLPLLEAWLAAGGEILALSEPPAFVDGRPSDAVQKLRARYSAQWHAVTSNDTLLASIRKRLQPRIEMDAPLGFSERFLASGDRILFLTNTGLKPVKTQATIPAGSLEVWDSVSGKTGPAAFSTSGAKLTFPLELAPAGSLLLIARDQPGKPAVQPAFSYARMSAPTWKIEPASINNPLVLDYCDLQIGKDSFKDINTWRANWIIWQRHGFKRPAWDNAVQYKRAILDRNHFPKDSGFTATYRFTIASGVSAVLNLAVETPWLYTITVNGKPVQFNRGSRFLDPNLLSANIRSMVRDGENIVEIKGSPFDVHMELENIYVMGAFTVEPAKKGFSIRTGKRMTVGSWAKQGMPFYSDRATYEAVIDLPPGYSRLKIEFGEWNGAAVRVLYDGTQAAVLGWPPYSTEIAVTPGKHTLQLQVAATPRNLFGPFHNPAKLRMRAWPAAWAEFPEHQPPGSAYDILDYGLMQPPTLSLGKEIRQ